MLSLGKKKKREGDRGRREIKTGKRKRFRQKRTKLRDPVGQGGKNRGGGGKSGINSDWEEIVTMVGMTIRGKTRSGSTKRHE